MILHPPIISKYNMNVYIEKDMSKYDKVYQMRFAKVYPLLVDKAVRKGRTKGEVEAIFVWLTGYAPDELRAFETSELTYGDFFRNAPAPNPRRGEIKGKICGISIETIEEPLMREMRYADKLVDDLAKGKDVFAFMG